LATGSPAVAGDARTVPAPALPGAPGGSPPGATSTVPGTNLSWTNTPGGPTTVTVAGPQPGRHGYRDFATAGNSPFVTAPVSYASGWDWYAPTDADIRTVSNVQPPPLQPAGTAQPGTSTNRTMASNANGSSAIAQTPLPGSTMPMAGAPTTVVAPPPASTTAAAPAQQPGTFQISSGAGLRPLFSFGQDRKQAELGYGIVGQPVAYVPGEGCRNFLRWLFP